MKVESIETFPIRIPFKEEYVHKDNAHVQDSTQSIIIKVHTDEGLLGIGEDVCFDMGIGRAALDRISETVIGKDPLDVEEIHKGLRERFGTRYICYSTSIAAVDIALYDIIGKQQNLPLYKLLGGRCRTRLEDHRVVYYKETNEMVKDALRFKEQGFKTLEVKAHSDLKKAFKNFKAILEAVKEDVTVIGDANANWHEVKPVIRAIKEIEHLNFAIEQPLPPYNLEGMAEIVDSVTAPVVADEAATSPEMVMEIIRRKAADVINIKLPRYGGIYEGKRAATIAEVQGVPCRVDIAHSTAIVDTALTHLGLTIRNLVWPGSFSRAYLKDTIVKSGGAYQEGSFACVPDGLPGLGLEIDDSKLKKFLVNPGN